MRPLSIWKYCFGPGFLEMEGRAGRAEFWTFSLLALPLALLLVWLMLALEQLFPGVWSQPLPAGGEVPRVILRLLLPVVWLGLIIPAVCVSVRRLHDLDANGRWVIAALAPGLAALACWLAVAWGGLASGLSSTVLMVCAGGLAVLEGLAVLSLGLVFLGDGRHGPNDYGPDPLGRAPRPVPPTDANGLPLATDDEDDEEIIDLEDVASPQWHDVPRVDLDQETEERLRTRELAQEAAPAVRDVVRLGEAAGADGKEVLPSEAFAVMVARALRDPASPASGAPAGAVPEALRGKGDCPPPDLSPEEMSLAAQSLADLAARADGPSPEAAAPVADPPDEALVDSLLEEMEQAEDARREAACIRPGQTVGQAMQRLEAHTQEKADDGSL